MAGRARGDQLHSAAALLLLLMAVSLPAAALADADFLAATCNNTSNPENCLSLLGRDPRSVNATTVLALANIGLDVAAAYARDSAGAVNQLSEQEYEGVTEGEALLQCTQVYGNAVEDLDEARDPLNSGDLDEAAWLVSAAEDAGDACEGAFADRGVGSVVAGVDRRMKEQCGVVGDLIDLLSGEFAVRV